MNNTLEFQFGKIDICHWIAVIVFFVTRVIGYENAPWAELYQAWIRAVAARWKFAESIKFTVDERADYRFGDAINDIATGDKRMFTKSAYKWPSNIAVEFATRLDLETWGQSN